MAPQLPTRKLGKNGPQVPAVGFGLMGLSAFYGTHGTDEERFQVLDRAHELDETFWDSADIYMDNETLIGKWFKRTGKRNDIFLATKFANKITEDGAWVVDSSPEYAREACEKSLKRLGVDVIDLYYVHRVDGKTPIEKTVQALVELKNEGKIKYLGLSEVSSETLRRACKVHHIDAVQVEYSPFSVDIEDPSIGLLQTARELGVAIVCYSPLGRGFLTGRYQSPDDFEDNDFRKVAPRFSKENFPKNLELVHGIAAIAKKKGVTPGQLTLAWELAQGEDFFVIPGTQKIKYLEENVGAVDVTLTTEEVKAVRDLVSATEVHGARYPEYAASSLFGDTPPL
jgi:aryl-alcohol dehydrogenase-like predicted oxidoreductase